MSNTVEPVTKRRNAAFPKESRELAKTLYLQGLRVPAIAEQVAVPLPTVRKWIERGDWFKLSTKSMALRVARVESVERMQKSESKAATESISCRVRGLLAGEVEAQVAALVSRPPKPSELANSPAKQGRSAVLKTLADSASAIFDWRSQTTVGLIVVGSMQGSDPENESPVIDVLGEAVEQSPDNNDATSSDPPEA